MKIDILTLFPQMFDILQYSIIGRAIGKGVVNVNTHDIREYTLDKHRKVDDYPYGGGAGMVLSPQPVVDCIKSVKKDNLSKVFFLGPRGATFNQNMAKQLALEPSLIFLCGHYEGIDERVYNYIDEEISLGDFVLTGGEAACIPIIDSICRMIPGVLSCEDSYTEESFYNGLLEYPQYTRPFEYDGEKVPPILISGHHENIRKWRRLNSLRITKINRPDLLKNVKLSKEEYEFLKNY